MPRACRGNRPSPGLLAPGSPADRSCGARAVRRPVTFPLDPSAPGRPALRPLGPLRAPATAPDDASRRRSRWASHGKAAIRRPYRADTGRAAAARPRGRGGSSAPTPWGAGGRSVGTSHGALLRPRPGAPRPPGTPAPPPAPNRAFAGGEETKRPSASCRKPASSGTCPPLFRSPPTPHAGAQPPGCRSMQQWLARALIVSVRGAP